MDEIAETKQIALELAIEHHRGLLINNSVVIVETAKRFEQFLLGELHEKPRDPYTN